MPWIESHLDQQSHLGAEPDAQSTTAAQDALADPTMSPEGVDMSTAVAAPIPKILGMTKQQLVIAAVVAVVVLMVLKRK